MTPKSHVFSAMPFLLLSTAATAQTTDSTTEASATKKESPL